MNDITVAHGLGERHDGVCLWRPCLHRIAIHTHMSRISSFGRHATQPILISCLEIVIPYERSLQFIAHRQGSGREILTGEHVVAHLRMRATQGKHHRIGKQGTRRIDHVVARAAIVSLVVIDIGCKDRGMLMVAQAIVSGDDVIEIGKLVFWCTTISIAISPYLIIAEIHILIDDLLGSISRHCIHNQGLLGMSLLHGINE